MSGDSESVDEVAAAASDCAPSSSSNQKNEAGAGNAVDVQAISHDEVVRLKEAGISGDTLVGFFLKIFFNKVIVFLLKFTFVIVFLYIIFLKIIHFKTIIVFIMVNFKSLFFFNMYLQLKITRIPGCQTRPRQFDLLSALLIRTGEIHPEKVEQTQLPGSAAQTHHFAHRAVLLPEGPGEDRQFEVFHDLLACIFAIIYF